MGKIKNAILTKNGVSYAIGFAVGAIACGLGCSASYKLGGEMALNAAQKGLDIFHGLGYVKFFDPETGKEITQDAACKLIRMIK